MLLPNYANKVLSGVHLLGFVSSFNLDRIVLSTLQPKYKSIEPV